MAIISGTNLAAGIVPFTTEDTYPTHYSSYGKGGHRSVQAISNRDSLPIALRELGMTVYVIDVNKTYRLTSNISLNTGWIEEGSSSSSSISNLYNIQELPNPSATGVIDIDLINTVFKVNVGQDYSLSINVSNDIRTSLINKVYSFEFHLYVAIVSNIVWPSNTSWIGGIPPVVGNIGHYVIVFRTIDAGTSWISNLAYTY